MADIRHLPNAPIAEAIIDIQVNAPEGFESKTFLTNQSQLESKFPMVNVRYAFESKFSLDISKKIEPELNSTVNGYMFRSEDKKDILQFRVDGFTRNRLSPYSSWDVFFPDAIDHWNMYCGTLNPTRLSRVAVRFINRFDVPLSTDNFGEFLTAPPTIPDNIPNILSEFMSRIVLHDTDSQCSATLIKAIEPSLNPNMATIIIDIDAWKQTDLSFDKVEQDLNTLRELKNTVFFNTLTPRALEMFK